MSETTRLGRVGVIGRFKPLHNGGALMLEAICENADQVVIGLGSSNKYNVRNPFTVEESAGMIQAHLSPRFSNYQLVPVPDFGHIPEFSDGKKWKEYVKEQFGFLDYFVSDNAYASELLKDTYKIIHPTALIPPEQHLKIRATEVRLKMARYENWQALVPEAVANYLETNGLVDRFRKEFGLQTIAAFLDANIYGKESYQEERDHTQEK